MRRGVRQDLRRRSVLWQRRSLRHRAQLLLPFEWLPVCVRQLHHHRRCGHRRDAGDELRPHGRWRILHLWQLLQPVGLVRCHIRILWCRLPARLRPLLGSWYSITHIFQGSLLLPHLFQSALLLPLPLQRSISLTHSPRVCIPFHWRIRLTSSLPHWRRACLSLSHPHRLTRCPHRLWRIRQWRILCSWQLLLTVGILWHW